MKSDYELDVETVDEIKLIANCHIVQTHLLTDEPIRTGCGVPFQEVPCFRERQKMDKTGMGFFVMTGKIKYCPCCGNEMCKKCLETL